MKTARIISKVLFFMFLIFDIAVFGAIFYLGDLVGADFKIKKGDTLNINSPLPVTAVYNGTELSSRHTESENSYFKVDLKMFGIIPFSTANVQIVDQMHVVVLGKPFGMKLYTKGVLVVDITAVPTEEDTKNPAKEGGIEVGDYILSVNSKKISTNEDLLYLIENSRGEEMQFKILRNGKELTLYLTPVISKETGKYKLGIWVRDSSAGIGTLTFYSPTTNIICGLGHGVCDEDTGEILNLESGEIVSAEIYDIVTGQKGNAGQLKGRLTTEVLGEIALNCEGGVYSKATESFDLSTLTEIALKSEIKNGKAQILCTTDGKTPKLYDCKISLKKGNFNSKTQNLLVEVTDTRLLEATGGIVQGLSGSPLLQNGKLIGAVTHVLIDDPTKGYGIFAENMLENAQSIFNNVGTGVPDCPQKEAS
ncbi:MAG: SpoIVB peptidase [Clostridia bacterium]|nr:SpoIVB peptidase [Clostridia bacterium]